MRTLPWLLVLLAAVPGRAQEEEKVSLRLAFREGQILTYRTHQRVVIGPSTHTLRDTYRMTVTDVDIDGRATLSVKFAKVAAKAEGLQEYDYDSDRDGKEPKDPSTKTFAALVGQTFTLKVSPLGRISEVRGFERIQDELLKASGGELEMPLVRQVISQMLSNPIMTTRMQQIWMVFPEGPTAKGETWKDDFPIELPYLGRIYLMTTSTLDALEKGSTTLAHTAKPRKNPEDDLFGGLIQVTKARGTGRVEFSRDRKAVRTSSLDLAITVTTGKKSMDLELNFKGALVE